MPRRARIVAAGFPMHAILRGIDRAAIFFADEDYDCFKTKLSELATAESVAVHAYVLITNYVHLLMTPDTDAGVPRLMKGLGQRYVQYINRSHRRTGTLFEGRFRSSLILVRPELPEEVVYRLAFAIHNSGSALAERLEQGRYTTARNTAKEVPFELLHRGTLRYFREADAQR